MAGAFCARQALETLLGLHASSRAHEKGNLWVLVRIGKMLGNILVAGK